ncbi:hypothetical protein CEUSTIGMA_g3404.t1 [Chlamydomonas eustigma]|uniref:sulfate adenylyltransferase n=1 Tax=Chlamydomonas eustigma TaxID=1157962 RepID=A0A250WYQ3_9CHLO|nr:hypothetical protein CEUSTIGMA_g3404.t1 [Chlamydomonas eustigma]|eukprot:GAX75961.1 hypothetical protein CEUSTIGMA_g3404.t1 [Chlamydomonas eustigma]
MIASLKSAQSALSVKASAAGRVPIRALSSSRSGKAPSAGKHSALPQEHIFTKSPAHNRSLIRTMAAATVETVEGLQVPHGGQLINLQTPKDQWDSVIKSANKTMEASDRNACDVELLSVGGFSPLTGFLNKEEYESVVADLRLKSGVLFSIPVVLDTDREDITVGDNVLLTYQGQNIAVVTVESKWVPNKPLECLKVYGTSSLEHPAVQMVAMERGRYYIGGKVQGLEIPKRVFPCATPSEVRSTLPKDTDVLAFQCRNPIHRAHYELFIRALDAPNVKSSGVCLVHPTCGPTQDDDIPGEVRYLTYEVLKAETNNPRLRWAYLPYSMHMAGPREAIQHMIIRKNYGCTHFIIGRDMAGCKSSITGNDFYGAYDAQDLANKHAAELGMQTVPSLNIAYTQEKGYVTADIAEKEKLTKLNLSGTKFRQMLRAGEDIPEWFAFKSVVKVLREQAQAE